MSHFDYLNSFPRDMRENRFDMQGSSGIHDNVYTPTAFHVFTQPSQPQPPPPVSVMTPSVKQVIRMIPTQSQSAPAKTSGAGSRAFYDREKTQQQTATNTIHNLTGAFDTLGHIDSVFRTAQGSSVSAVTPRPAPAVECNTVNQRVQRGTQSSRSRQRERVQPDAKDMQNIDRARSSTGKKFQVEPLSHLYPGEFPHFSYLPPPPELAVLPQDTVHIRVPQDHGVQELVIEPGQNVEYMVSEFAQMVQLIPEDEQILLEQVCSLVGKQYSERYTQELTRREQIVEKWREKRSKWLKAGGDPKKCVDLQEQQQQQSTTQIVEHSSARDRSKARAEQRNNRDRTPSKVRSSSVQPKWIPSTTSLVEVVDGSNAGGNDSSNASKLSVVERTMLYQQQKEANLKQLRLKKEKEKTSMASKIVTNKLSDKLVRKQRQKVRTALAAVKFERDAEAHRVLSDARRELQEQGDLEGAENVTLVYEDKEQQEDTIPEIVDDVGARLYLDALQRDWHQNNKIAEKKEQDRIKEEQMQSEMYPHIPESNRRIQAKAQKEAQDLDVFTRLDLSVHLKQQNQQLRDAAAKEQQEKEEAQWFKSKINAKSEKIVSRMAESHYEGAHTMWSVFYERLYKDHFDRIRRGKQRALAVQNEDTFTPTINQRSRDIVEGKDEQVGKYKAALWGQLALLKQVVQVNNDAGVREVDGKLVFPESFFRTDAGKVYMDKMRGLVEKQLQEIAHRMEELRREMGLTSDAFINKCDKYTGEIPGDELSVLTMQQQELLNQQSMLDIMVNRTLEPSPKVDKLTLLKKNKVLVKGTDKSSEKGSENKMNLNLGKANLQLPSSNIVSTKKLRQIRDAAVDAIASAHDNIRKENAAQAKQVWLDEVYRSHHQGRDYSPKTSKVIVSAEPAVPPRGRSRSTSRKHDRTSNSALPFSRTRQRSISKEDRTRKQDSTITISTFPDEYLRMLPGRSLQIAKSVSDDGYVSCTALLKLDTLGYYDHQLLKACLQEIAEDKKTKAGHKQIISDAEIHTLHNCSTSPSCEDHLAVWATQRSLSQSEGWLHEWESWRMTVDQFRNILICFAKYIQVRQTEQQVKETAEKQQSSQDKQYWTQQAVLAAHYADELKQDVNVRTEHRLRVSLPTKEVPRHPQIPLPSPQQHRGYSHKYHHHQRQQQQQFAQLPFTHPPSDSIACYAQYANIAK